MPRRVYTYLPDRGWDLVNMISTVGAFIFAAGVLIWIIDMVRNFRPFGPNAGNVFDAPGLEWLPNDLYSMRSLPIVTSRYPLWDQPNLSRDVEAGRYFLPNAPTGDRETLSTSPLRAEPQYVIRMPRPSGWHVWAAAFTAGTFLLLTIQAYIPSAICAVLTVYCLFQWCWMLDRPRVQPTVDIGAGIMVPTYMSGPRSHGWWAMVITLIVALMILVMTMFSYVFLWSRNPLDWVAPPETGLILISILYVGAMVAVRGANAVLAMDRPRTPMIATGLMLAATALIAGAWGLDFAGWWATGLTPQVSGQGATVFYFIGWQGFFVGVSAIMGLYALLRWLTGHVEAQRPATFQLIGLFLAYTAAQGLSSVLLTRLFPGG